MLQERLVRLRDGESIVLTNTFCHLPGIGPEKEKKLWSLGFHCWDDLSGSDLDPFPLYRAPSLNWFIEESVKSLAESNPHYFMERLPSAELWRLFPEFRDFIAYVDIESTGLNNSENHITTIALYDGKNVSCYVYGHNLDDFKKDIENYKIIVTYNGRVFDVPFMESYLKIRINQVHIDLRFLLKSLGYSGGLKGCERRFGLDRGELNGVDGYYAVLLWDDFIQNKNQKALETLLAYNIKDTVSLETLMVHAYNLKLSTTPFMKGNRLRLPEIPASPFRVDVKTIARIKRSLGNRRFY